MGCSGALAPGSYRPSGLFKPMDAKLRSRRGDLGPHACTNRVGQKSQNVWNRWPLREFPSPLDGYCSSRCRRSWRARSPHLLHRVGTSVDARSPWPPRLQTALSQEAVAAPRQRWSWISGAHARLPMLVMQTARAVGPGTSDVVGLKTTLTNRDAQFLQQAPALGLETRALQAPCPALPGRGIYLGQVLRTY